MRSFGFIAAGAVAFLSTPGTASRECYAINEISYDNDFFAECVKCVGRSYENDDKTSCMCDDQTRAVRFGGFGNTGSWASCTAGKDCGQKIMTLADAAECDCGEGYDKVKVDETPLFKCRTKPAEKCKKGEFVNPSMQCAKCPRSGIVINNVCKTVQDLCGSGYSRPYGKRCQECSPGFAPNEDGTECIAPKCFPRKGLSPIEKAVCRCPKGMENQLNDEGKHECICQDGKITDPSNEKKCCIEDPTRKDKCCQVNKLKKTCQNEGKSAKINECKCTDCKVDTVKEKCKENEIAGRKNKYFNEEKCRCESKCPLDAEKCDNEKKPYFNEEKCKCQCPLNAKKCGGRQFFDKDNCKCLELVEFDDEPNDESGDESDDDFWLDDFNFDNFPLNFDF